MSRSTQDVGIWLLLLLFVRSRVWTKRTKTKIFKRGIVAQALRNKRWILRISLSIGIFCCTAAAVAVAAVHSSLTCHTFHIQKALLFRVFSLSLSLFVHSAYCRLYVSMTNVTKFVCALFAGCVLIITVKFTVITRNRWVAVRPINSMRAFFSRIKSRAKWIKVCKMWTHCMCERDMVIYCFGGDLFVLIK